MTYAASVLADSITPQDARLLTLQLTYPRFVHPQLLTHRVFSRNSASSRAIPVSKMLEAVEAEPVTPLRWGTEHKGMTQGDVLAPSMAVQADGIWYNAMHTAVLNARQLAALGVHKSIVNRLVEPFAWVTTILTGTYWDNFFNLRLADDVQPELQRLAEFVRDQYEDHIPTPVSLDDSIPWHLPLVYLNDLEYWQQGELSTSDLLKLSVARCARVSYLTHDGKRDPAADFTLYERLLTSGHLSPFEHQAMPSLDSTSHSGNLRGWVQYRQVVDK